MEGKWNHEEEQYLIMNRDSMTVKELAEKLNRSYVSVLGKTSQLGIKKKMGPLVGSKINKITILKVLENGTCECSCQCGKLFLVKTARFYGKEAIKSCGCHKKIAKKLVDIKTVSPEDYSYRFIYARYLNNAKIGHMPFTLTFEDFIAIIKQNCTYCGIGPRPFNAVIKQKKLSPEEKEKYSVYINGIDRIDSEVGYTPSNVSPACKECNYAKRTMTLKEWYSYLDRIFAYRSKLQLLN